MSNDVQQERIVSPLFADSGKEVFADDIGEILLKRKSKGGSYDILADEDWFVDGDPDDRFEISPFETTQQEIGRQFGPGEYCVIALSKRRRRLNEHFFKIATPSRDERSRDRNMDRGRMFGFRGRDMDEDGDDEEGFDSPMNPWVRREPSDFRRRLEEVERQQPKDSFEGVAKLMEAVRPKQVDPLDMIKLMNQSRSGVDEEAIRALREQFTEQNRNHRRELDALEEKMKDTRESHRREVQALQDSHRSEVETLKASHRTEVDTIKETLKREIKSKETENDELRDRFRRELDQRDEALREIRKSRSSDSEDERRRYRDDIDDARRRAEKDREEERKRHEAEMQSLKSMMEERLSDTKIRYERELADARRENVELTKRNKEQAQEIIEMERDLAAVPPEAKGPPPPPPGKGLIKAAAEGGFVEKALEIGATKVVEFLSKPPAPVSYVPQAPVMQPPVLQQSATQAPVVQQPVIQQPVMQNPVVHSQPIVVPPEPQMTLREVESMFYPNHPASTEPSDTESEEEDESEDVEARAV